MSQSTQYYINKMFNTIMENVSITAYAQIYGDCKSATNLNNLSKSHKLQNWFSFGKKQLNCIPVICSDHWMIMINTYMDLYA